MKYFLSLFLSLFICTAQSNDQRYIVKNIKEFGAVGNGKTSDHQAFQKAAAFFTARGGNGQLIIPKGTYIVGKQVFNGGKANQYAYYGEDVLHFKNVRNMEIRGEKGSIIKYADNLRHGSFDPKTGKSYTSPAKPFVNRTYAAFIGKCFYIDNGFKVSLTGITIDGNSDNVILGGFYGNTGIQLAHYGIFISNSKHISIDSVHVHHTALDGISVGNKKSDTPDNIQITNSTFEYNARQGLSWVGGNQLTVKNSKFNHTGRGKFSTSPGGGIDIEAEDGPNRNGLFEDCEMINNAGPAMGAASGNSADCTFKNCTFWGTTAASAYVNKPNFSFYSCNFYGTFAKGYSADKKEDATKFFNCHFEDKLYNGKPPFGRFLIEIVEAKKLQLNNCTFVTHTKKVCWFSSNPTFTFEDKYQLNNCLFTINNTNFPNNDFIGVTRNLIATNTTFIFTKIDGKSKKYNFGNTNPVTNPGSSGSKIIYKK